MQANISVGTWDGSTFRPVTTLVRTLPTWVNDDVTLDDFVLGEFNAYAQRLVASFPGKEPAFNLVNRFDIVGHFERQDFVDACSFALHA